MWGLIGGLGIGMYMTSFLNNHILITVLGLPPIVNFGSDYLKDKVIKDCLAGRKNICLAITEPSGGSDVANLVTEAKKTPDGKYYILNGEKKWYVYMRCGFLFTSSDLSNLSHLLQDYQWYFCRLLYCRLQNWRTWYGRSISFAG